MNTAPKHSASPEAYEITDRDRQMLDFEGHWFRFAGAKEQAIRDVFDMSATRYYQVLQALILRDEALAYSPMVVKRLRRLREERRRARSGRR